MTMHRFALVILIGLFPVSNAALAAGDGEAVASDVSEERSVGAVGATSVAVRDSNRAVGQEPWRIRRAKNPWGRFVLVRNETAAPLFVSFASEDGATPSVPPGETVAQRCDIDRTNYPLAVASELGETVLDAQLKCGDSVVVQSIDDAPPIVRPLEAINEAWALPPSESTAEPRDMAGEL